MPFETPRQRKACFATGGFGGKVNCKAWAKHKKKKMISSLHGSSGLPGKREGFREWVAENHPEFLESER